MGEMSYVNLWRGKKGVEMNIELNKKYFKKLDQELKLIPITYDFAFKKIFRSNLDILRDF